MLKGDFYAQQLLVAAMGNELHFVTLKYRRQVVRFFCNLFVRVRQTLTTQGHHSRMVCGVWRDVSIYRKHFAFAQPLRMPFVDGFDFYSFEPHLTLTLRFSLSHKNAPQVTH